MSQQENSQLSIGDQLSKALAHPMHEHEAEVEVEGIEFESEAEAELGSNSAVQDSDIDLSDDYDIQGLESALTHELEASQGQDSDSTQEQDSELAELEKTVEDFSNQPFVGLIKQRLTLVLGIGLSPDLAGYNYSNPFSKRLGILREYLTEVVPVLERMASANLLLITDNIESCSEYIEDFYRRLSVPQKYQSLFDSMLDFYYESNMEHSGLLLQTQVSGLNWASLPTDKGDAALTNALTYLTKLARLHPNVELDLQIGVNMEQLIDPKQHKAYALLMNRVERGELQAIQISSYSPESNFDIVFRKVWN